MSPLMIVILVIFVVLMLVWALMNAKSILGDPKWLAWGACLILGTIVFLLGSGVLVIERYERTDGLPKMTTHY